MNIRTADFRDVGEHGLTDARVGALLDEHARGTQPRLRMLWAYYRNALVLRSTEAGGGVQGRAYRLAQERGLPARIVRPGGLVGSAAADDPYSCANDDECQQGAYAHHFREHIDWQGRSQRNPRQRSHNRTKSFPFVSSVNVPVSNVLVQAPGNMWE